MSNLFLRQSQSSVWRFQSWMICRAEILMIDTALRVHRLTMAFSSRKPDGWRCLLPVSSGPYTDLGSANTMGLVLKALGSGAPDIFKEEWLKYLNIMISSTWRSHVFPIVKLWLSIDQGRCPVGSLVRISRGREELDTRNSSLRGHLTLMTLYLVAGVLETVDALGLGQQEGASSK